MTSSTGNHPIVTSSSGYLTSIFYLLTSIYMLFDMYLKSLGDTFRIFRLMWIHQEPPLISTNRSEGWGWGTITLNGYLEIILVEWRQAGLKHMSVLEPSWGSKPWCSGKLGSEGQIREELRQQPQAALIVHGSIKTFATHKPLDTHISLHLRENSWKLLCAYMQVSSK